jgi:hypothetical protein
MPFGADRRCWFCDLVITDDGSIEYEALDGGELFGDHSLIRERGGCVSSGSRQCRFSFSVGAKFSLAHCLINGNNRAERSRLRGYFFCRKL